MKTINLGKSTVVMNDNINRKKIYVDSKNSNSIKNDIIKQLDDISKSYEKLSDLLNKMSYKKMFSSQYNSIASQCSKKCSQQKIIVDKLSNDVDCKYNDDVKTVLINDLDERISYLEKKFLSDK